MDWNLALANLGKLILAALLGAAIGLERERHGRQAGLRTNLLVCLGSCLMMIVSLHLYDLFAHLDDKSVIRLDPGRMASYALAGMGFIGAGVIIKGRGSVRGVTTAATLWTVTGVGLAAGAGYVLPAIMTTALALLALYSLKRLSLGHDTYTTLTLVFDGLNRPLEEIRAGLGQFPGLRVQAINYDFDLAGQRVTYHIHLRTRTDAPVGQIVDRLLPLPGLERVSWERAAVP